MNRVIFVLTVALLIPVPALFAQKVDLRNYAVGSYDANPNEVRVAGKRAARYWQKNGNRLGEKGHFLAVEAAVIMPADLIQPLWKNMINAETGSGFLLPSAWNPGRAHCVMIYDTRLSRFVTKSGYLVVEDPHPGSLARFGDYIALYIKTGSSW